MSQPNTTRIGILAILGIGFMLGYIVACNSNIPESKATASAAQDATKKRSTKQSAGSAAGAKDVASPTAALANRNGRSSRAA